MPNRSTEFPQRKPGLPPDGQVGQYLGFDDVGRAYILRWHPSDGGMDCWAAVGFDPKYLVSPMPMAMLCIEENADRIKEWAEL